MNLSIILPTLWRPAKLRRALDSLVATTAGHAVEILVLAEDPESMAVCRDFPVTLLVTGGDAVQKWNRGAVAARGEWLMPMSDDIAMLPGWIEAVERCPNRGYVGMPNAIDAGNADYCDFYVLTRAFAREVLGGVLAPPCYRSWYISIEVGAQARQAGRYTHLDRVVMENFHYLAHPDNFDATYQRAASWHAGDAQVYLDRKARGFPVDWAPLMERP